MLGERYTFNPDWFGLGCIIYEMIEGHSPFRRYKEKVKRDEIQRRTKENKEVYSNKFSTSVRELCEAVINRCCFLHSVWLIFCNFRLTFTLLFLKILQKNPLQRLGCNQDGANAVKSHHCFKFNWKRIENAMEPPPFLPDVLV